MGFDRKEEQKTWQKLPMKTKLGVHALMDNVIFQKGEAYDTRTGEKVSHMVDVGLKTTDKQIRRLQEIDELSSHQIENGGFIFAFFKQSSTLKERFPTLTKQDTARLMYIATFISWETNRLQADNGKKYFTKKDIEGLVGMSPKRFNQLFRRLEKEGILHRKETGEIFVNPKVFYRGEIRNHEYEITDLQYTRLFKQTVRDLYVQFDGRSLGQLANIYAVLPFLNFDTNIICYNPGETIEDFIKPVAIKELAEILDYDCQTKLKAALNKIKVDNKPVFGFFENPHDRRQLRIVVNPKVVFAGNGESLKAITALFN